MTQRTRHVRIIRGVTGRAVLAVRIGRRELQIGRFPAACAACDGTGSRPDAQLIAYCVMTGAAGTAAAASIAAVVSGAARLLIWGGVLCALSLAAGLAYDRVSRWRQERVSRRVSRQVSGTVTPPLTGEPAPRDIPQPPRGVTNRDTDQEEG